jgi:hypothetical protein
VSPTSTNASGDFKATALVACVTQCSRQELTDLAIGMTVGDPGEDVGQVGRWIDSFDLQVSTSEAMVAQCSAPPSEPVGTAEAKWTKSADQILAAVKRSCHKAQQTFM